MQALWQLAAVSKSTVYARQEAAASILSSAKRHSDADTGVQRLLQRFPEVVDQFIRLCNHTGGDKRYGPMLVNMFHARHPLGHSFPCAVAAAPL